MVQNGSRGECSFQQIAGFVAGRQPMPTASLRVNHARGTAISEYSTMKRRYKLAKPRNDCPSLPFFGHSDSRMTYTFASSFFRLSELMMKFRKLVVSTPNSYLSTLAYKLLA